MKTILSTVIAPVAFLGLTAWAVDGSSDSQLEARSISGIGVDTDGDGLADLLERRFGFLTASSDGDGDGISDLEEFVLGYDPHVANFIQALPRDPHLRLEVYSSGPGLVLNVIAFRESGLQDLQLFVGTEDGNREIPTHSLASLERTQQLFSASVPGFEIEVISLLLPTSLFLSHPSLAVAVKGRIDGEYQADQLHLSPIRGELFEWRKFGPALGTIALSQSGGGGGLFPTDPDADMVGEANMDKVCVQTLSRVGSSGSGRVLYRVENSSCDLMPQGICFSGCSSSVGDSLVGIDIIGLLGN